MRPDRRPIRLGVAATAALLGAVAAGADILPPEAVLVENPVAKRLRFSTVLSRVRYRQETRTTQFVRPAGKRRGKKDQHTLRHDFQVSIWEVPSGSGILRMETLPTRIGAKVGNQVAGGKVSDFPVTIRYMLENGTPCNYYGDPLDNARPTALVFPDRPIAPGDSWSRQVAPSDDFEIPTQVKFTYQKEVRIQGRLCAVIDMEAQARGELPGARGLANLSVRSTFVFEERLGRVVRTVTRLFQSQIGKTSAGVPPEKRKTEQLIEVFADL